MSFHSINDVDPQEIFPGAIARMVHGATMTYVHWDFAEGTLLPEHSHVHEQISNVMNGEFEFVIDGKRRVLHGGDVAVIPSNAIHSGTAITRCHIIDVFHPVREDYR